MERIETIGTLFLLSYLTVIALTVTSIYIAYDLVLTGAQNDL